jgi:prepilin-type processing-associated H-X9-DG protein
VSQTDGYNNITSTNPTVVSAVQSQIPIFFCPSRRAAPSLSPVTTGSPVLGMPSDYAACIGDTGTAPTTGIFQLVNANHMTAVTRITDITDGASNTIMLGEKHVQIGLLNDPLTDGLIFSASETQTYNRRAGASNPLAISPSVVANNQFGSWHTGVCQFVFADGSVHPIANSIPGSTLGLLANKGDGLPVPTF